MTSEDRNIAWNQRIYSPVLVPELRSSHCFQMAAIRQFTHTIRPNFPNFRRAEAYVSIGTAVVQFFDESGSCPIGDSPLVIHSILMRDSSLSVRLRLSQRKVAQNRAGPNQNIKRKFLEKLRDDKQTHAPPGFSEFPCGPAHSHGMQSFLNVFYRSRCAELIVIIK